MLYYDRYRTWKALYCAAATTLYRQAHAGAVSYNLFAVRLNLVASIWEEMWNVSAARRLLIFHLTGKENQNLSSSLITHGICRPDSEDEDDGEGAWGVDSSDVDDP